MSKVFFSFEYQHDVTRAMVVRNSWVAQGRVAAGFVDAAEFQRASGSIFGTLTMVTAIWAIGLKRLRETRVVET